MSMISKRTMLMGIALASATLLAQAATAATDQAMNTSLTPGKTIVLVHGFFADGSSWGPVIRLLQSKGARVVAVQNPLSSLTADVEATRRIIDQQAGEVVLVGHSWGGMVVTEAGTNPKVRSLVYIAAYAPAAGISINELQAGLPPAPWTASLVSDDVGNLSLSPEGFVTYFAPDIPHTTARVMASTQGAFFYDTLNQSTSAAAWTDKRSWYIQARDDQIIDPALQRRMARDIGAITTRVNSSHVVMLSHPEVVAAVILAAAR